MVTVQTPVVRECIKKAINFRGYYMEGLSFQLVWNPSFKKDAGQASMTASWKAWNP
jgi:hypothetical protein